MVWRHRSEGGGSTAEAPSEHRGLQLCYRKKSEHFELFISRGRLQRAKVEFVMQIIKEPCNASNNIIVTVI